MRSVFVCFVALFGASHSAAQNLERKNASPSDSSTPLKENELQATIVKYENILRQVLELPAAKISPKPTTANPVKREMIIAEMSRLFEICRPTFKFTPRFTTYKTETIGLAKVSKQRANLEKLIKWGAVAKTDPFVISKQETVSLALFADAFGLFLIRMADLTHTPSSKWSPYLVPPDGG
jgi:hypothetical protein